MTQQKHIPLGVGFYPDWWFANYGISFGREYYYSPEYRVDAQAKMQKALYERFGDVGLGNAGGFEGVGKGVVGFLGGEGDCGRQTLFIFGHGNYFEVLGKGEALG